MSEYLSKEEVRQWRSSLERITLEEFAARLGKKIQSEKETRDIVDIVLAKSKVEGYATAEYSPATEKITNLYKKTIEIEKNKKDMQSEGIKRYITNENNTQQKPILSNDTISRKENIDNIEEMNISFKKALTAREQAVFDYFISNRKNIIYAKDLAKLLDLPRDYVYKYIKNLRNKLNENIIYNAENGGFVVKL